MKKLRALLVDDEPEAIAGLTHLILKYCPSVLICGTSTDAEQAVELINSLKPDVVFLDIEMPVMNGFQLIDHIRELPVHLVFVTAHQEYAVRAFKVSAVDYLLKPVDYLELCETVKRIEAHILEKPILQIPSDTYRIKLVGGGITRFYSPTEIICIRAEGRYSEVMFRNFPSQLVTRNIGEFEQELNRHGFFRIHKSWLVNVREVLCIQHTDGGFAELSNGKCIEISRRKRADFISFLNGNRR